LKRCQKKVLETVEENILDSTDYLTKDAMGIEIPLAEKSVKDMQRGELQAAAKVFRLKAGGKDADLKSMLQPVEDALIAFKNSCDIKEKSMKKKSNL